MDYKVIYSKRKTLSLCIRNGGLVVCAPYGLPAAKIEEAIARHRRWIDNAIARTNARVAMTASLTESDILRLKREAAKTLSEKTACYAKIMGARYGRVTVTSAKTRFGSCSAKGNISYSYRLMLYPEAAIDYVVVHELAHTFEMNHSPRFWAVVAKYMPDYKERKKLLKPEA